MPNPLEEPSPTLALDVLRELQTLDTDGTFIRELLLTFREDTATKLEALHECLRARDAAELARVAHGVVGASRTLGAARVGSAAKSLEILARTKDISTEHSALLRVLSDEIERALIALTHFVEQQQS